MMKNFIKSYFFYLYDFIQVIVGGQFQFLFFGLRFNVVEATFEAEVLNFYIELMLFFYQDVEQLYVDEVEELGEQLDGEGSIYTISTQ